MAHHQLRRALSRDVLFEDVLVSSEESIGKDMNVRGHSHRE